MENAYFLKKQGLYDPQFEHDSCGVGFVCNIKGKKSNDIIRQGLTVLEHISHRGAVGTDPLTGDGAGILIQIPYDFYADICSDLSINLPTINKYGTGLVFLPTDKNERKFCKDFFAKIIGEENQILLGWRNVPVNDSIIGKTAKDTQPVIEQIFIKQNNDIKDQPEFERKLYVIRKRIENFIYSSMIEQKNYFYITNLSSRTISYKGLLRPDQIKGYYLDLQDERIKSALALVHSRYSTNTFPTWDLAQPFRFLAHNGEINTLRGNVNWMRARERLLSSELFGNDIPKIKPIIVEGKSDSAIIDNVFELLVLAGRLLPHAMMMLIPSAWEHDKFIKKELYDFYQYHACLMEPWDGPAAIAFTDGKDIGAVLDRNGLRPARYIVTKKDFVVMASEVGVLDINPGDIKYSGRLEPGKMFFIDTERGCIVDDSEIKKNISASAEKPYGKWLEENVVNIETLTETTLKTKKVSDITTQLKAFSYSREDLKFILGPMVKYGKEPIGSMGCDTPHAFLSKQPQILFNYFKQLFAQVTNPAIDPIREKLVMSMESFVGPEKNILEETPEHAHRLKVSCPILTNEELDKISDMQTKGFETKTIYTYFNPSGAEGKEAFGRTLDRICFETEYAIESGYAFIILSDRGVDKENVAIPSLLTTSAVHHHLVRKNIRSEVGIIVDSGEPREVHHFALLFGYGADCICPYLAYSAVENICKEELIDLTKEGALKNYRKALIDGILKILSKMGISTLRSYRGAQIFEALGLQEDFVDKYFTGTSSRIGGCGLVEIAKETLKKHKEAYPNENMETPYLATGGVYQWKRDGEFHLWNPFSISALQDAARCEDYNRYREFAELVNNQSKQPTTLRSLLKIRLGSKSVPISEVESVNEIVKRFVTGAMSFGSISKNVHETLAIAMNRLGGKSNTGEGGEDPARFIPLPNGDSARSAIKQVASGRFGVTANYLINADELQIKIAQGAKPGEGGQLPGHKVSAIIARTRYTTPGVTLISPPPHHDIYSIEDLAQLIFDLKNVNPQARISVKLVSEIGVGTVAAGVAKGHADMILISGGDGGTGASPRSSIRYAGLPWELGLSETQQTLVLNDLRSRVRLQTDGQMRTGRDVAIAALLGAEEYGFSTGALITLGCVMLRHCHLNNCSVGVATQDPLLQKRFKGRPEYVINYLHFVAQELREIMAELGVRKIDDMVGRTDLLELNTDIVPQKAKGIDFSNILYKPQMPESVGIYPHTNFNKVGLDVGVYCQKVQDHGISDVLDRKLIELSKEALSHGSPVTAKVKIKNADRTTGAMLSGEVCKIHGESGLPEDTINIKFSGVAGQSFGAFLARGITFTLSGLANDYVGKGMSGGKIIIHPDKKSDLNPEQNIIIGNTCFYGSTSGEAYISGVAGERFCIRNSGLYTVIEGVGDHGCEYMTAGRVVILGRTGRNFAAGMSGGIAYVYDKDKKFKDKCNMDMVILEELDEDDRTTVYNLIHNHHQYTGSSVALRILNNLNKAIHEFIKVMPIEYKRILESKTIEDRLNLAESM